MAITYTLTANSGKVRLALGDSVDGKGPRPRKTNFSDDEIAYFLTAQGDSINKATAMGLNILGNEWLAYSIAESEGDVDYDAKGLADSFFKRAKELSSTPDGGAIGELSAGVVTLDFMEKGTTA
jgi:hypothetical protein